MWLYTTKLEPISPRVRSNDHSRLALHSTVRRDVDSRLAARSRLPPSSDFGGAQRGPRALPLSMLCFLAGDVFQKRNGAAGLGERVISSEERII